MNVALFDRRSFAVCRAAGLALRTLPVEQTYDASVEAFAEHGVSAIDRIQRM